MGSENGLLRSVKRRQIVLLVSETGGLSLTELGEQLDVAPSTVRYHVDKLVSGGLVVESDIGHKVAVYPANTGWCRLSREIHACMSDLQREVLKEALYGPGVVPASFRGKHSGSALYTVLHRLESFKVLKRYARGLYLIGDNVADCAETALEGVGECPCQLRENGSTMP